ncbi:Uncharacterized protein DAT39_004191 [Clarias magur]|uniref:Uncharacterized protein n=1 Tax=Clarias magur TaxID=1594786 RepID=A0A8J4U4R2_CLAMG|nr:Uncharacterized protein DAT39_004191 [Clarias magur]
MPFSDPPFEHSSHPDGHILIAPCLGATFTFPTVTGRTDSDNCHNVSVSGPGPSFLQYCALHFPPARIR